MGTKRPSAFAGKPDLQEHLWRADWRALGYNYQGIYAITPDNRWPTKIGISQNVHNRLAMMQSSCWRPLQVVAYRYCTTITTAREVEAKAHGILREEGKIMCGEWFDIRAERALEVIEFAALMVGKELRNDIPDGRVMDALERHWRRSQMKDNAENQEQLDALSPEQVADLTELGKLGKVAGKSHHGG